MNEQHTNTMQTNTQTLSRHLMSGKRENSVNAKIIKMELESADFWTELQSLMDGLMRE